MAKQNKRSSDVKVTAFQILEAITGEQPCHASPVPNAREPANKKATSVKNPAAVAIGRLDGLKGGKAKMAKHSAKRRSEG
jgi:hypothetical protein